MNNFLPRFPDALASEIFMIHTRAELGALAALHDDYLGKINQLFEKIERTDLLRYSDPRLTALVIYKTAIPLLETLQNLDDFDCLFISSMKSLIFKNIP